MPLFLSTALLLITAPKILPDEAYDRKFGADAPWYRTNVPLFECADPSIERTYDYRWTLYKGHIRDLGAKGFLITEFLDDVGWQKHPYAMLNDATGFHIYEGRWLRNRRYLDGFVDFLYAGGGNDRHFSESIADASDAYALATGDSAFVARYLPAMRHVFNLWDDHYDFSKGLYFIEPLLDATEYTVSSIDASGAKDGFFGGDAFRPTINSYQFANARAISRLSAFVGDKETARDYADRAEKLKGRVQNALWNEKLGHFTDRYKVNNEHVKYWEFIRARELAGFVPWTHGLPDDDPKFNAAWRHLLDPGEFAGPYGLRTIGPGFEHYMRQYRYLDKQPECQWNGPSWPFQTTQVLLGIANLLNGYRQTEVSRRDYLSLLRQYSQQHYLDGTPNLQEDYHPDTGKPIVGLDRSHHYNHSGYTDLIVTGLCGLRPRADDVLELNPLLPDTKAIPYFCLQDVPYHGHDVTILWDADGTRYGQGAGLSAFVDGKRVAGPQALGKIEVALPKAKLKRVAKPLNTAVNVYREGYPQPSASSDPEKTVWQAIDGRTWFFPEMPRGWTPEGTGENWLALDYGEPKTVGVVTLAFLGVPPEKATVQYWDGSRWKDVRGAQSKPLIANGPNNLRFAAVTTDKIRVAFQHAKPLRVVEIETHAK